MFRLLVGCLPLLALVPALLADPGSQAAQAWWSLRPLRSPALPRMNGSSVRNPVDAFVRAKLREKGLRPSREADRRTLIRRLSFDLLGLPPTPQQIAAYLNDPAPDAYERLVDRLLASPHYGERWARHWMDAVHYAETHGHDQDRIRPNAWPYRDYLIAAFNGDKPYGRFVEEQLAADALFPDEPALLPALGFLAAGPWDESSLRDIREDSTDRQVGYYLDRDDMVTTTMATFASLTVHCARCHDHKFDPITQEDYYSLQAVFAGVGRADRVYDADPVLHRRRQRLRQEFAALERRDPKVVDRLLSPEFEADVRAWEARTLATQRHAWTVLDPLTLAAADGTTLTRLADASVLAGGKRPERDRYTVTAHTALKGITAIRLEVLTDDSLPHHGPGRQDNGNFHLSEFRVRAALAADPGHAQPVAIADATADFDQAGWTARHAIDGQLPTAWGIYPKVGTPHEAVFALRDRLGFDGGTALTFELDQQHGGGHLIGRLRLSVTTAVGPVKPAALPEAVARAAAVAPEQRNRDQKLEVAAHYLREKLRAELATLPPPAKVYAVASDFAPDAGHKPPLRPRPVHLLKRGDIRKPGALARPGAPACVAALPSRLVLPDPENEATRRAALAKWLTDPNNPLTWRSIVNRVWQHHFGRGLVETPNDFGRMGALPTHPELLDWLAVAFRDGGQSLKQLHRLLVTSATYRQVSDHDPANARSDADNRYLWRMDRSRLDAESVRDAILAVSDRLDRRAGGPSDEQFTLKPGLHVTPLVNYEAFAWDRPAGHRRSVYRFVFRTLPDPFVDCLDGADASQLTPVRTRSASAPQALALLNNAFVLAHSRAFAAALEQATSDRDRQLAVACERVWGRPPTAEERAEMRDYAARHGLANLCRLLFNSDEFLFVN
jgi:Protein of unknown function (DUF1553)/Protein of unknown function (DUF1549)